MSMPFFQYENEVTSWQDTEQGLRLTQLCGVPAAGEPQWLAGNLSLATAHGPLNDTGVTEISARVCDSGLTLFWSVPAQGLRVESRWQFHAETGIWRREDFVENVGQHSVTLTRALARFPLAPAPYRLYTQSSRWCYENQGQWNELPHGSLVLTCVPGRTTSGANPYLALTEPGQQRGVAFHLLPVGNWTIRVTNNGPDTPFIVEMGLADENLRLTLAPGDRLEFPPVLLHGLPQGQVHLAAPRLHQHLVEQVLPPPRMTTPLVYNTWFDRWDHLEVDHLREELAVAREIGCEVFVVDAGWYGDQDLSWNQLVGNWREKQNAAFHGKMKDFADEVRTAGLGFGLWMEPERVSPTAPIAQEHPEWLLPVNEMFRWDLENPEAYAYVRSEIFRLVEQYRLAWMKIDFNAPLGVDRTGAELYHYYQAWYRMLEELRETHPDTFFEGCAGGGGRLDLNTLARHDGHFLSDNVNPHDVLRLAEGAWLRLPPGRIGSWAVLRAAGATIGMPGYWSQDGSERVATPRGALWEEAEAVRVDFVCRVALVGVLGFSGCLASLGPQAREQLRWHAEFYKVWRGFLRDSVAHLLTPPAPLGARAGWRAVQLLDSAATRSLLLAYRLEQTRGQQTFRLRGLDPKQAYRLTDPDAPETEEHRTGLELMREGVTVYLPGMNQAAIRVVECVIP